MEIEIYENIGLENRPHLALSSRRMDFNDEILIPTRIVY